MGDSLGNQIESALSVVISQNPLLRHAVRLASWDTRHARARMSLNFIPSSTEGALALLRGVAWPRIAKERPHEVRIVVA